MTSLVEQKIKFRHITCFLEVKTYASFTVAAETLHLTQPAVSKAISELEDSLGVTLFKRNRSGVSLTAQGEVFSAYAASMMKSFRQGLQEISQETDASNDLISIGVMPTVMGKLMPEVIRQAKLQRLNIVPKIIVGPNDYLLKHLQNGDIDLVVGRLSPPDAMQGLVFEQLYSDRIVFVVRPEHPLAAGTSVLSLAQITPYTIIMPPLGSIIRPAIEQMMLAGGISDFPDVIETVAPAFSQHYTYITDAVWIISRGVVTDDIHHKKLIPLVIQFNDNVGPVGITTKAGSPLSLVTTLITKVIRDIIKNYKIPG